MQVVANSVGFNSDGLTVIVVVAWGPLVGISPSAMLRGGAPRFKAALIGQLVNAVGTGTGGRGVRAWSAASPTARVFGTLGSQSIDLAGGS